MSLTIFLGVCKEFKFILIYFFYKCFFFNFFLGTLSKQHRYYLQNRDKINEARREQYKEKKNSLEDLRENSTLCNENVPTVFQPGFHHNTSTFLAEAFKMESSLQNIHFGFCHVCRERRLGMQTSNGTCSRCNSSNVFFLLSHQNNALPIWKLGNKIMYNVPKELQNLKIAEKLLNQRVSPLMEY